MNRRFVSLLSAAIILSTPHLFAADAPATQPAVAVTYSSRDVDQTPQGHIPFHGPFCNDIIEVSTGDLAAHDFLEISFDLLILRSWDGSVEINAETKRSRLGPDYFRLALADGPTLMYTTFSNWPDNRFRAESKFQNYPSQVPGEHLDAYTAADARNTLGYNYPFPGPPVPIAMDATYKIHFVIPHRGPQAIVQFGAMGLSSIEDENWGFTDVRVRPLSAKQVQRPDATAIRQAFATALEAASSNQITAFQALILGMDDTADWIARNVEPQPIDAVRVKALLADMFADDSRIDERAAANQSLDDLGPQIEPYLRDARRTAHGEQRTRIDRVLNQLDVEQISDEKIRRVMLATRVLEIIGTPRALEVRKSLTEKP